MKKVKIAAGLAHVDYGHIADVVKEVSDAGADYIHCDAADMHDLKNLQLMGGIKLLKAFVLTLKSQLKFTLTSKIATNYLSIKSLLLVQTC